MSPFPGAAGGFTWKLADIAPMNAPTRLCACCCPCGGGEEQQQQCCHQPAALSECRHHLITHCSILDHLRRWQYEGLHRRLQHRQQCRFFLCRIQLGFCGIGLLRCRGTQYCACLGSTLHLLFAASYSCAFISLSLPPFSLLFFFRPSLPLSVFSVSYIWFSARLGRF